jgi:2-polyprenyl-3-methyl-5-hydroxy-6-metoxy-1,4-benzoquinol methylase
VTSAAPGAIHRACPLCAEDAPLDVLRHEPWRLARCPRCELHYLPEIPSEEAVEADFDWAATFAQERRRRWFEHPLMRFWTMAVFALRPSREGRALRQIRRHAPGGRLIDVGCGDGRLAMLAMRRGYDVLGIELSPRMAAKAARRIGRERVRCARLEDARDLAAGSFDVAVTVSYLEHEPNPLPTMVRMRELLRPGGVCIHKTPNYASRLREWLGPRWSGYRWPEHVQYYTPETLGELLRRSGFEPVASQAPRWGDNMWNVGRRA